MLGGGGQNRTVYGVRILITWTQVTLFVTILSGETAAEYYPAA